MAYRDLTFDIVAGREAKEIRAAKAKAEWLARRIVRRADPACRAMRRRKIQRLLQQVMSGNRNKK